MVRGRPSTVHCTTMMTVWSVASHAGMANFRRRSTTGMTLPRRLMTPRTKSRVRGTRVISMSPMISRTLRISRPYSSRASWKVMYLPARRRPSSALRASCPLVAASVTVSWFTVVLQPGAAVRGARWAT